MRTLIGLAVDHLPPPARRRLIRADPGMLRTARGSRAMFAFMLTLGLAFLVAGATGASPMSFAIGFPVTLFACAAIGDDDSRVRFGKIVALAATAGAMFTLSALVHPVWISHLLFVAVVGLAAYLRQYGGTWIPVTLAANVSYFFGAFLRPDSATLHWQWAGVALGAVSAVLVHQFLIPHRPARRMNWALLSIRLRIARLLRTAAHPPEQVRGDRLRNALRDVMDAVHVAETQMENLPGGRLSRRPLAEALSQLLVTAERLVLRREREGAQPWPDDDRRTATAIASALRAETPLPEGGRFAALVEALDAVAQAAPLAPDRNATPGALPALPDSNPVVLRPGIQAAAATALAIAGGTLFAPERWYWAVITVFVILSNTHSRGQALFKSLQRAGGTLGGIVAGMVLVALLGGSSHLEVALMPVAIFCMFYAFLQSYTWMAFFLTIVIALLFAVTGRFDDAVLLLRLEETAIGALAAVSVAAFLLPRGTAAHARDQFRGLTEAVRLTVGIALAEGALDRLSLAAAGRMLDDRLDALRDAVRPVRIIPIGSPARYHRRIQYQLDLTSYWIHEMMTAARKADSEQVPRVTAGVASEHAALEHALAPLAAGERATAMPALDPQALVPEWKPAAASETAAESLERACAALRQTIAQLAHLLDEGTDQPATLRF